MYSPLPDEWDNLIRSGVQRRAVVDIYGDPSVDTANLSDIAISSFSVTVDRRSSTRRAAQVTIVNEDLLDELIAGGSSLEPYGSEVRLRVGFVKPDGNDVLIPVGRFQIEELTWDADEASIEMSLFDRSQILNRSSFGVHIDASGKQANDFIQDVVSDLVPYAAFIDEVPDGNLIRLPGGTTYRAGMLAAVEEAAKAMAAEFYFDVNGSAKIIPVPYLDTLTFESEYDWKVDAGETGVLISYNRKISRRDTYNKIHVYGAPAQQNVKQPYGFAVDDNPASPTYYGGRFGKADKRIERQELTSDGQCRTFALSELRNSIGLSKSLSLSGLSNPALDAGDTIRVEYPSGLFELHLIDSLTFDHTGAMQIETRVRQTVH
jgi:hypothetical protein